jgi:hypothetical protein
MSSAALRDCSKQDSAELIRGHSRFPNYFPFRRDASAFRASIGRGAEIVAARNTSSLPHVSAPFGRARRRHRRHRQPDDQKQPPGNGDFPSECVANDAKRPEFRHQRNTLVVRKNFNQPPSIIRGPVVNEIKVVRERTRNDQMRMKIEIDFVIDGPPPRPQRHCADGHHQRQRRNSVERPSTKSRH